jgi:hypothetical protein
VKLRHATPYVNLESIFAQGLDPIYAVTLSDRKWIWLHTPRHRRLAIAHTSKRHKVPEEDVVILEVSVARTWLCSGGHGIWKCPYVIEPERIKIQEMHELLIA